MRSRRVSILRVLFAVFTALLLPMQAVIWDGGLLGGSLDLGGSLGQSGGNPPVAAPDVAAFRLKPGVSVKIAVLANDSDPDGNQLSITSVTPPISGSARIEGAHIVYTPRWTFTVEDRFTYQVTDSTGRSSSAEVTVSDPLHEVPGTYDTAMVSVGTNRPGHIQVVARPNGTLTATARIDGKVHRFAGTISLDGHFTSVSASTPGVIAALQFTSSTLAGPPVRRQTLLTGSVTTPVENFALKPTEANGLPSGVHAQSVTLKLSEEGEAGSIAPYAIGYGTGKLSSAGRLRLAGRLPNGRSFSTSAWMKVDGSAVIDTVPAGGRSRFSGEFIRIGFDRRLSHWTSQIQYSSSVPSPDVSSFGGFDFGSVMTSVTISADLGTYDPNRMKSIFSAPGGSALLSLQRIEGAPLTSTATVDDKLRFAFEAGGVPVRMQINRTTGLATGAYFDTTGTPSWRPLRGVVCLPLQEVSGVIPAANPTGTFTLTPQK